MALANVVNVAAFVGSMQGSIISWFERSIRSDIFVFAGREVKAKFEHPLPEELDEMFGKIDGVEFVNSFRMIRSNFRDEPYYLLSHELEEYARYNEIPVAEGNLQDAIAEIKSGKGIAASTTFAHFYDVGVGDELTLTTPDGPRSFRVAMVYADYSADIGILGTTREVYREVWKDPLVDSFGIYVKKGSDVAKIRDEILATHGSKYGLMALLNADYRTEVLALIERSFALTHAMELVAIVVAVLGIVNTLLVTVIDRKMEIGILKAIGATGSQVRTVFVTEASLIGFASSVAGVAVGSIFAVYIVKELLYLQIGWHMDFRFPWRQALQTMVLAQVVALVGSWWPARRAARLDVVEALEYE
jgi:putative ABC transport system permease protein